MATETGKMLFTHRLLNWYRINMKHALLLYHAVTHGRNNHVLLLYQLYHHV